MMNITVESDTSEDTFSEEEEKSNELSPPDTRGWKKITKPREILPGIQEDFDIIGLRKEGIDGAGREGVTEAPRM
ncbi:hypothetical protein Hamer_G015756, partial [Homarus americanus]